MYERDWSAAGCSGYIEYSVGGGILGIGFSNPVAGKNKIGCGLDGKSAWDKMEDHGYKPFVETFRIGGVEFVCTESCTGGDVNQAKLLLSVVK